MADNPYQTKKCSYCDHTVREGDFSAEIDHMTREHPEVVADRLNAMGDGPHITPEEVRKLSGG